MAGYDAFISYSHAADGTLAPRLQTGLQRLARRWNQRRALHVFRDQTGLAVTPHLWASITEAMDTARWFVLLASPESARSEWVGKEIEHWLERPDGADRMLLVVTDGVCDWDGGGFTPDSTAVHPALRHAFAEEPLYQDLTWAKRSEQLDLHDPRFRDAIARLAAPMHGVDQDDLVGEDIRQYKLARRLRRAAFAGLATLTTAAVIASILAVRQKDQADANAAQSRSRELATTARATMDDDPVLAALLAVEANYPNGATRPIGLRDAEFTLGSTLRRSQWASSKQVGPRVPGPATHIAAVDGDRIATVDLADCCDALDWWDLRSGRRIPRSPWSASAERAALQQYGSGHVTLMEGAELHQPDIGGLGVPFTTDATTGAFVGWDGQELVVRRSPRGRELTRLAVPPGVVPASVITFPSGRVVALATSGELFQWSLATGGDAQPVPYAPPEGSRARSIAPLGPDSFVVDSAVVGDRTVPPCALVCDEDPFVTGDVITASGLAYVGTRTTDPRLEVVDLAPDAASPTPRPVDDAAITVPGSYAVAPDAAGAPRYVAARTIPTDSFGDAEVVVWDVDAGRRVATISRLSPTDLRWLDASTVAIASARGVEQVRVNAPEVAPIPTEDLVSSADGRVRAVRTGGAGPPAHVVVLDGGTQRDEPADPARRPAAGSLTISADGRYLADTVERSDVPCVPVDAACIPPTAVRIRTTRGRDVATLRDATGVGFADSGHRVAIGRPGRIRIATVTGARVEPARDIAVGDLVPRAITWVPGRDLLVVRAGRTPFASTAYLVDASGRRRPQPLSPPDAAASVAVSPDGRLIATGAQDGSVQLWELDRDGARRAASVIAGASPIRGLAFDRDGTRLATSGPETTAIWDLSRPSAPRRLDTPSELPALAAVRPADGTASVRTSASGAPPAAAWGQVAFAADGRSLTLAGPSGVVRLPDLDPALACSLASPADLAAVARTLGGPSACTRVDELRRRTRAAAGRDDGADR